jgi:hypothetical protein
MVYYGHSSSVDKDIYSKCKSVVLYVGVFLGKVSDFVCSISSLAFMSVTSYKPSPGAFTFRPFLFISNSTHQQQQQAQEHTHTQMGIGFGRMQVPGRKQ